MEEVIHMPARKLAVFCNATDAFLVVLSKQLHANHSKDEDNDGQNQSEVSQSPHRVPNDLYQHVEGWPRLGKLKHSHLDMRQVRRQAGIQVRIQTRRQTGEKTSRETGEETARVTFKE